MAAAELKPAYLVLGGDRPKIVRALARLRARFGEEAVERLSGREVSGADAVAACNALALFAVEAGRLVLVDEVERWKADDVKAVEAYLAQPAPATVLALTGEVKPDAPLARVVRKRGEVLVFDVRKRALPAWVAEQFERLRARADADACRALVEVVGEDVAELASEVDKLATWAAGDVITAADVEALAAGRAETAIFAVTDAWGRRDAGAALAACEALLERSQRPRRDEVARLAGLLAGHVARVRECRRLAAEGVQPREAAGRLKMHPFAAEKAFAHAASFGDDELREAIVRLAALDLALKGGSKLPAELELERALVELTEPRAAASAAARPGG